MNRRGFLDRALDCVLVLAAGIGVGSARRALAADAVKPDGVLVFRVEWEKVEADVLGVTEYVLDELLAQIPARWKRGDWQDAFVFCLPMRWVLILQDAQGMKPYGAPFLTGLKHRGMSIEGHAGEEPCQGQLDNGPNHVYAVVAGKGYPLEFAGPQWGMRKELWRLRAELHRMKRAFEEADPVEFHSRPWETPQ